jgi:RNA polymerase sigma-70 factor (ECF subfamily)
MPDAMHFSRGDMTAFRQLIARLQGGLLGFFGRMGFAQADAEELAQETFLAAWRQRERFDPARGALSTWVYVIARSRALNELDRQRRQPQRLDGRAENGTDPVDAIADDPARTDPERLAERGQQMAQLRRALQLLSDDDRLAIALFYVQAMTVAEAAEVLGCTAGAYRTRLSRARQRLLAASKDPSIQTTSSTDDPR